MRCLVMAEVNTIGKSVNGAKRLRMASSKCFMARSLLSAAMSHLLTHTTSPFLFFEMSENMLAS